MNNTAKKSTAEFPASTASDAPAENAAGHAPCKLVHRAIIPNSIAKRLALSESGFVFDPVSGQSFTVNETGLATLRLAQQEEDATKLLAMLGAQFNATADEIKRDVLDFADRLKDCIK